MSKPPKYTHPDPLTRTFSITCVVLAAVWIAFSVGVWPELVLKPMFQAHLLKKAGATDMKGKHFNFLRLQYNREAHKMSSFIITDEGEQCIGWSPSKISNK
jgi:hypothetical protein